jgi:hypothetical protein
MTTTIVIGKILISRISLHLPPAVSTVAVAGNHNAYFG